MPIIIEGPDGQEIEFPDGTSDAEIKTVMRTAYPPTAVEGPADYLGEVARMAAQGATFGSADEIEALARSQFSDREYGDILNEIRKRQEGFREDFPVSSAASEIGGGVASALATRGALPALTAPIGAAMSARPLATGAATGALGGGAYEFGAGEGDFQERMGDATRGALTGSLVGGVAGKATSTVADFLSRREFGSEIAKKKREGKLSSSLLKEQSNNQYKPLNENRVSMLPEKYDDIVLNIDDKIAKAGAEVGDKDIYPQTSAIYDRLIRRAGKPQSMLDIEQTRRLAMEAMNSRSTSGPDSRALRILVQEIDDQVAGLTGKDFINPNNIDPKMITDSVKKARELYGRAMRSDLITKAMERAESSASGMENGLRKEFRSILRQIQDGKLKGFSAPEVDAIKDIVEGKGGANLFRSLGRFSFGASGQSRGVGPAMGLGVGVATGTDPLAIIGGSQLASETAERMAKGQARTISDMALLGAGGIPAQVIRGQGIAGLLGTPQFPGALQSQFDFEQEKVRR